jgi:hypothetical protein
MDIEETIKVLEKKAIELGILSAPLGSVDKEKIASELKEIQRIDFSSRVREISRATAQSVESKRTIEKVSASSYERYRRHVVNIGDEPFLSYLTGIRNYLQQTRLPSEGIIIRADPSNFEKAKEIVDALQAEDRAIEIHRLCIPKTCKFRSGTIAMRSTRFVGGYKERRSHKLIQSHSTGYITHSHPEATVEITLRRRHDGRTNNRRIRTEF